MKSILIILIVSVASKYALSQNCSFILTGHVEDTDTKDRLHAATVFIKEIDKQIVTDNNGDFIFEGLCAGDYTIQVSHINCETVQKKITVAKNFHIDIFLPHEKNTLAEVRVESVKETSNTGFKKELSGKALQETRGMSLSEAFGRINGVTILQTGSTISKPIIHGLHSNRILTINNGVRQEGQQWGNEHAPEIDPFIADKLTVIKGVEELKYGSDAIGGVILVDPKPLRNKPGYSAEINTGYFTNNQQYVASGIFEQQLKKYPAFAYRVQGTFKKAANVATPGYRLNNTASEEKNFSLTAVFKKEKFNTELFYSRFAARLGIFTGSHIGNLTDLQNAIAASKPAEVFLGEHTYDIRRPSQQVSHHLLKSKTLFNIGGHKLSVLLSGQYNRRKEYDIVINNANTKPQMDLSIMTLTEDVVWEHPKKNNFNGSIGISAMQQENVYGGRYFIPNYQSYTFGSYLIEKWAKRQWELQAGIRYDNKNINTTRLKFGGDTLNYDFNFSTLASSFNTVYKPNTNWQMNVNIALASRAPHVNELLSNGIHHGTATYEEGDIFLKPEQSVNISAGAGYHNVANTFSFDVNIYNNYINNFIYEQPFPDEPVLTIAGAFPKIKYQQTDAVLRGADISATVAIFKQLYWNAKLSFLRATNKKINDWLILMPADRFGNEFTYTFKESHSFHDTYISAELQNVLQQTRVPSDKYGRQDYKEPPGGYMLLNMNASATIHLKALPLTFGVGVRNILNTPYRDYLNSFRYFTDEMGRNINLKIRIPISHNH